MEIKQKFTVLGAKAFNGSIEGKSFDSTTRFVVMPVSETKGMSVGQNAVPMRFGKSEEFDKLKSLPFPLLAELGIRLTASGYEVASFQALPQAKP